MKNSNSLFLFEGFKRANNEIKSSNQSDIEFLDQSAWPSMKRIRWILNNWFLEYPPDHAQELKKRFFSTEDTEYLSAFFELYTYTVWTRHGYMVSVHPKLSHSEKTPDFLVRIGDSTEFYVECKCIDPDKDEVRKQKLLANLEIELSAIDHPDFLLFPRVESVGNKPFKVKPLINRVKKWLEVQNWNDVATGRFEDCPQLVLELDEWEFELKAIPKKDTKRGKLNQKHPVPINDFAVWRSKCSDNIVSSIRKKSSRYGKLDKPYVIAINDLSGYCSQDYFLEAIYGSSSVSFQFDKRTGESLGHKEFRSRNGAFWTGRGVENTRVSGVLGSCKILPHTIAKETPRLWHNPMAEFPLATYVWLGPQKLLANAQTNEDSEVVAGDILTKPGLRNMQILRIPRRLLQEYRFPDDGEEGLFKPYAYKQDFLEYVTPSGE